MKKLASAVCWEGEKVKGSRFVTHLIPISTRSEVSHQLSLLWDAYPKATHICYAWRLFEEGFLCCDDGEPKGSAGAPILRHLDGAQLVDVLGAVVRFYGGTKLGVGGLVRAYGGGVSQALKVAYVEDYILTKTIKMELSYSYYKSLISLCELHNIQVLATDYEEKISLRAKVPLNSLESFLSNIQSVGYGRVTYLLED